MIWVWTVSLPVTILNSPNVTRFAQPDFGTGRDIAGCVLFGIGFVMESVGDLQKLKFKLGHKEKGAICDKGFWAWSRHPNYFGEIIVQFGKLSCFSGDYTFSNLICIAIFMIAVSPAANGYVHGGAFKALYASILGPILLTTLLLFVSGLTLQERPSAKKRYEAGDNWDGYVRYLQRTSILIPLPPQIYTHVPVWLKRTLLFEFPMYVFDPTKHASGAMGQRGAEQGEVEQGRGSGEDESVHGQHT